MNILSTKKDEDHEKAIIEKKINDIIAALNKEQQASEQQAENLMLELVNELAKLDEDLAANTTEDKLASEVSKVEKAFGFLIRQHKLDTEQPTDDTERQQELVRPMSRSIPLSTPANTLENTPVKDEKKPEPPEIDHQWLMAILGIQREEESLKRKREKEREPPQRGRSPSLSR